MVEVSLRSLTGSSSSDLYVVKLADQAVPVWLLWVLC
jgi:hypothetical protein